MDNETLLNEAAFQRLEQGDFSKESLEQLITMFEGFLSPEKVKELRLKHAQSPQPGELHEREGTV